MAVGNGCSNETLARIGDGRGAGIADHHDLLASGESIDHRWGQVMLGVLVAHAQGDTGDAQMAKQRGCATGVLAADHVGGGQRGCSALGDVVEIADRGGDENEAPGHLSSTLTSTVSPVWSPHRSNDPARASMTRWARGAGKAMRCRVIVEVLSTHPSRSR